MNTTRPNLMNTHKQPPIFYSDIVKTL